MKKKYYYISLYIVVPIIFSGMAIFSTIIAFRITSEAMKKSADLFWPIFSWLLIIAVLAFFCGMIVIRLLLRPVEQFVRNAEQLPALARGQAENSDGRQGDELQRFTAVFDQVTGVLSNVEARVLFPRIIGQSLAIRGILSQIMKVAPTDSTVLISGESGTGKELAAVSIHQHSPRKARPFIKLNCVAIPESLLESELFGHEKGAFTGATNRKLGKFEMAHGGTLFLDEIGDMPLSTQAKVLRTLQEREFERVGGTRPISVDVRFIAATNKNLEKMVKEGTFREDLYYRLNVFFLYLPPLKERREDIPELTEHFLSQGHKRAEISPTAMQMLMAYSWPGNVRQLENVLERAAVMCENGMIEPHHLTFDIRYGLNSQIITNMNRSASLDDRLMEIERAIIRETLQRTGGVQVRAAELLGINQRSLWHRVKKYKIDIKDIDRGQIDRT
ncbi:MAG TPA: sigma-54 dependent transcriptional regulator [Desulfatiglandales bacterium]|nr:sigma-54 dependent transcriptional regulator [Desulfatiglandales bacterium]